MSKTETHCVELSEQLLHHLLRGDDEGIRRVIAQVRPWDLTVFLAAVLAPALRSVGELWATGEISVAHEHAATQIAQATMAEIRSTTSTDPAPHRSAVVACVPGELHELGARMAADVLSEDAWSVSFLGANTPASELAAFARERRPGLVALAIQLPEHEHGLREAVSELAQVEPAPHLIVGGASAALAEGLDVAAVGVGLRALASVARNLTGDTAGHRLDQYLHSLGGRIRQLRQACGWSQRELSAKAGLDRTYISGLERGQQNPSIGAVMKLSDALDVPLSSILVGK